MGPVLVEKFFPSDMKQVNKIKEALKQCKDEWLETKKGKNNRQEVYMGHNTIRQILDHAVNGITYWDFGILEQWKEEVYAYNKQSGQWYFDGYVYHVKGYLFIPGVGYREQYGCKVAVGGKDNQDSAYKSAASNCLNKCASLFGVGEQIYSKIKVDADAVAEDQYYQEIQNNPYMHVTANTQPPQWTAWNNQSQANGWSNPNPNGYMPQGNMNTPTSPANDQANFWQQVDQMSQDQNFKTPFDVEAQPQGQAQPQQYQAQPQQAVANYGAPVQTQTNQPTTEATQPSQPNQQSVLTPWDKEDVHHEMERYHQHKQRLNITNDNDMIPYLRDYFKDENANFEYLTPETLKGFNDHLEKITV